MQWNIWLGISSIFGMLGVALGAFGAHALRSRLEPRMLEIFETGVRYQMYHVVALFMVAFLASKVSDPITNVAGSCFIIGTLVFSGSLYILALSGIKWLGAITPVGGVFLIVGWILTSIAAFKYS